MASVRWWRQAVLASAALPRIITIVTLLAVSLPAAPVRAVGFGYALGLPGPDLDEGRGVATDSSGNVYAVGFFTNFMDVDPGPGVVNVNSAGFADGYIIKYSPTGALVWSRTFGGSDDDQANAVAVDAAGTAIYVTGFFHGTVNFGGFTLTGNTGIFVAKLNPDGSYAWARSAGSAACICSGLAITVDGAGNVYTTGTFSGTVDFDPGAGTSNLVSPNAGNRDVFVWKLTSAGTFVWAKRVGGTDAADTGSGIATDGFGNVYLTGVFGGMANLSPGPGFFIAFSAGGFDVFVVKLSAGGDFQWAYTLGASGNDEGRAIGVDAAGNVYVTGKFEGAVDFDHGPGTFTLTSVGAADVYVLKLDTDGGFVWADAVRGPSDFENALGMVVDRFGDAYVTGTFAGHTDFDPGPGEFFMDVSGFGGDIFVLKLDADGNFVWARDTDGLGSPEGFGVAIDGAGNVYTTGFFSGSADFDPGPGTVTLNSSGVNVFVWKLSEDGPTNTVPGPQTAVRDTPRVFSGAGGNRIAVGAPEAGSGLGMTLSATHGTLTLASTTGLKFDVGNGTANTFMTFVGSTAATNAALNGLRYTPDPGFTGSDQINVISFLASPNGPVRPDTDTVPITVQPGACTPRPGVHVQTAAGGGKLLVTITPTPVNGSSFNTVTELRFGTFANARVTFNNQPVASGQTVAVPPAMFTSQLGFTVERVTPGQAVTVPLTIVDGCGAWRTFVGAGTAVQGV